MKLSGSFPDLFCLTPLSLNRKLCDIGAVKYAYSLSQKAKQIKVVLSDQCVMIKATMKTLKSVKTSS